MHLHDDPAAGSQLDAVAGLAHGLLAAGRPGTDPGRVVDVLELVEARAAEAGPALAVLLGVDLLGGLDLLGRDLEEDDVVDDLGVAGLDGRAGQPLVLAQLGIEEEAPVVVGAFAVRRGRGVGRRHRQRFPALTLAERTSAAGSTSPCPAWAVVADSLGSLAVLVSSAFSVPPHEASRRAAAAANAIGPRRARKSLMVPE